MPDEVEIVSCDTRPNGAAGEKMSDVHSDFEPALKGCSRNLSMKVKW